MHPLLAAVPYRTLPDFTVGPITVRSFGLMVALGIVLGAVIGSRYVANRGIDPEQYTNLATRAVIAGLVGARLAWVVTHIDQIATPIDVIAVWDGGMQFSGGLVLGALVGWWSARGRYSRTQRWHLMDGSAVGLTAGLAVGRLGCLAVGEHFGGETNFILGMTYQGGGTVEPVQVGQTIHNTAFYELLHLAVLGAIMAVLLRRAGERGRPWPLGMMGALFLTWYGAFRFLTDVVRVNDERLAGLTGAQWAGIFIVVLGLWLLATMQARKPAMEGSEMVPTTMEPRSAVKVIEGTEGPTTADADGADPAADGGDGDDSRRDADTPASHVTTSAGADLTSGDAASPETATSAASGRARQGRASDEATWAERADVTSGSSGYVSGVRVMDAGGGQGSDAGTPDAAEDGASATDRSGDRPRQEGPGEATTADVADDEDDEHGRT